jgi:hypothetical protein
MSERTTVRLPLDLLNRARRQAAAEGRTLTSLVEEGLRLVLARTQGGRRKQNVLPRVSKATGGPVPGLDLPELATLQEIDDLQYVVRSSRR